MIPTAQRRDQLVMLLKTDQNALRFLFNFVFVMMLYELGHKKQVLKQCFGAPISSDGRVGVPCTEALSSLQWPRVQVPTQDT